MLDEPRRFPPPWTIEELDGACFIVRDIAGQPLTYVYYKEESGWRSLTRDDARRLAAIIAKLPELVTRS